MPQFQVSVINIEPLWFFADFVCNPQEVLVKRLRYAGIDEEKALLRAKASAQTRQLPFVDLDVTPDTEIQIVAQIKQLHPYKKAVRQHQKQFKNQVETQSQTKLSEDRLVVVNDSTLEQIATAFAWADAVAWFDGSSTSAGVGGAAVVIDLPGSKTITKTELLSQTSNSSIVEYAAAVLALREALELGVRRLLLQGDSQEVINYLKSGSPRNAKSNVVQELHNTAIELVQQFEQIQLEWIPRQQNQRAHSVASAVVPKELANKKSTQKQKKNKQKTNKQALQNLSLPKISPVPSLNDQIERLINLGSKAPVYDYENLKSGWDEFSKLRLPALTDMVPIAVREAIATSMPKISEKDLAKLYRWILRGLPLFMAVRKLEVDEMTAKSVIKARRRFY